MSLNMKKKKLQKKPLKFSWQDLPRKQKKVAKKLLQRVINTNYDLEENKYEKLNKNGDKGFKRGN